MLTPDTFSMLVLEFVFCVLGHRWVEGGGVWGVGGCQSYCGKTAELFDNQQLM